MKRYIVLSLSAFMFLGCSIEPNCPAQDELKTAGICADMFYVNDNVHDIDKISYAKLVYKNGRYYTEDELEEERELAEEEEEERLEREEEERERLAELEEEKRLAELEDDEDFFDDGEGY